MDQKDLSTEETILQAAREIFTRKGRDGARMQEIADHAKVNKTLLHYYYRSKEKLFYRVVEDVIKGLLNRVITTSFSPSPFKPFLRRFINNHIDFMEQHQDMLGFLLWELKKDPQLIKNVILKQFDQLGSTPIKLFSDRINTAIKSGEIRPIKAMDFIINLASLDIFVFALLPVISPFISPDEKQLKALVQSRKKEVFRLLWNDIAQKNKTA